MKWMMANPRKNSYSNNQSSESSLHGNAFSCSSSIVHFLKKPHAFPFLLSVFLLLTWVSLRLQHSARFSSSSSSRIQNTNHHWNQLDDSQANLIRFSSGFPSRIAKDKRGWLLNPVSLALDSAISGMPVSLYLPHCLLYISMLLFVIGLSFSNWVVTCGPEFSRRTKKREIQTFGQV